MRSSWCPRTCWGRASTGMSCQMSKSTVIRSELFRAGLFFSRREQTLLKAPKLSQAVSRLVSCPSNSCCILFRHETILTCPPSSLRYKGILCCQKETNPNYLSIRYRKQWSRSSCPEVVAIVGCPGSGILLPVANVCNLTAPHDASCFSHDGLISLSPRCQFRMRNIQQYLIGVIKLTQIHVWSKCRVGVFGQHW